MRIDRREFSKGVAASATLVALGGISSASEVADETWREPYCFNQNDEPFMHCEYGCGEVHQIGRGSGIMRVWCSAEPPPKLGSPHILPQKQFEQERDAAVALEKSVSVRIVPCKISQEYAAHGAYLPFRGDRIVVRRMRTSEADGGLFAPRYVIVRRGADFESAIRSGVLEKFRLPEGPIAGHFTLAFFGMFV